MEVINLKDLPLYERPREKAKRFGIKTLSNSELLALIIGSGFQKNNVLMLANKLLAEAQSLKNLFNFTYYDFIKIAGIKSATAFRFLAFFELIKRQGINEEMDQYFSSDIIAERYLSLIGKNAHESMYLIALNEHGVILFEHELYVGTHTHLVSSEEEIISALKKANARFFVLIHNHPSGITAPSEDDRIATNHLMVRAKQNNLTLLDHIIVGPKNEYYSFRAEQALLINSCIKSDNHI